MLRIYLAQMNFHVGAIEQNAEKMIATACLARDQYQADLVVFPELALIGYPPEDLLLRDETVQRVQRATDKILNQVQDIVLVLGGPTFSQQGDCYNSAILISDGQVLGEYHKAELPNYSVFDEKRYFRPGTEPLVVSIKGMSVGLTICEDIWSAGPAAKSAAAGAQLIINLNASPFYSNKQQEREQVVSERAKETGLPILYINLVGGQDELVFDGGSFAVDQQGLLVHRGPLFEESGLLVEIEQDGSIVSSQEIQPRLSEEEAVYQALVLATRDYVTKNGFRAVVIGLSGGIDSALTLAIAVDALGADQVEAVLMPSRYTTDMSNEDAIAQAKCQGVSYSVIPIEPAFKAFQEMLADEFHGLDADVTEENIQARCRGVTLMAISNKGGRMLLTTGNKSEMSVGYATLYGDMAGGFAPLKDVSKLLVYRLAKWRNQQSEVIPERVIERPPSAELRPDQKDSDSLPAYEILDPILELYIEQDSSISDIVSAGFDQQLVQRIAALVDQNEYKRRQSPPGVKITRRAFGRDRRYPITSGF